MKQHFMTYPERIRLETMLRFKVPVSQIAKELGCCRTTIYCEIKRGTYNHTTAHFGYYKDEHRYSADKGHDIHRKAMRGRGRRPKAAGDQEYMNFLEKKILKEKYSPAAALAAARRAGFTTSICVNTLYTYIDRGYFKKLSNIHLQEKVKRRRKKPGKEPRIAHEKLPSIEQRPEIINQRSEPGHWEMDLVIGKKGAHPCLLTLTERRSRQELIFKLPNKKPASVQEIFNKLEKSMGKKRFREKFKSITTDNGIEFMQYEQLKKSIYRGDRFQIWYCHSFASWEKGTNENHNRIIRRWFPKGTDFSKVTPHEIQEVQEWMNNYPRKILGWKTPNEVA